MCREAKSALREAEATLAYSREVLGDLEACIDGGARGDFSMARRHAIELHRYLDAHRSKLEEWHHKVRDLSGQAGGVSDSAIHLLATRRFEIEETMRFVNEAFIRPRRIGGEPRVLEAADWMCVEGFQLFTRRSGRPADEHPVGPIVALDSQRSPAVWKEDAELRIPSLFDTVPVRRGDGGTGRALGFFPVICLPSDLARLPEYYPLLSHEVGHAVDTALGLSKEILETLGDGPYGRFWRAWMREIVADAVGLALSGEAFALALWRFVQRTSRHDELSHGNDYPPTVLRLAFLRAVIGKAAPSGSQVARLLPADAELASLSADAMALDREFGDLVLPELAGRILSLVDDWGAEQESVRAAAKRLTGGNGHAVPSTDFRLFPSVLTLATIGGGIPDTREVLLDWHDASHGQSRPAWVSQASDWRFREEMIPTLRPTLLGTDGRTKVPPTVLLLTHRKIAFLGATNKWLHDKLGEAVELREGEPWESIDIYFASDSLLEHVEYYDGEGPAARRIDPATLRKERDAHLVELKRLCRENREAIGACNFYFFDGPPLFASYWDWDEPGGRIHVSAQLLGIDLGKCPSTDILWLHDTPTYTYECYRRHLEGVVRRPA